MGFMDLSVMSAWLLLGGTFNGLGRFYKGATLKGFRKIEKDTITDSMAI